MAPGTATTTQTTTGTGHVEPTPKELAKLHKPFMKHFDALVDDAREVQAACDGLVAARAPQQIAVRIHTFRGDITEIRSRLALIERQGEELAAAWGDQTAKDNLARMSQAGAASANSGR